jgi:hypothetical protein
MKRNKAALLILSLLVVSTVIATTTLQRRPQKDSTSIRDDEATPTQEGVMTEKERQHSKLFRGYGQDVTRGKTLRQLVSEKGDVNVGRFIGNVILQTSFSLKDYLKELACRGDAIVVGTVKDRSSNLIEEGTFTFTDYQFVAEEVLKDNPTAHIQPNSEITIVRVSGIVKFDGHIVRTIDYSEKPLKVGSRYILFLRFVPVTGSYRSFGNALTDDSFQLGENEIIQVSDQPLPFGAHRGTDTEEAISQLATSPYNACDVLCDIT